MSCKTTAPTHQASETHLEPTFGPFSQLPPELRRDTWKHALPSADRGPGVCVLSAGFTPNDKTAKLIIHNPHSPLLAVSREARETALESLPLTRDYDPETDILYLDEDSFYPFCDMCREEDWPGSIQHLALALSVSDRGLWLPIALQKLFQLRTISVVYPRTNGVADSHEHVPLPKQPGMILRRFTEKEMDDFKISADYMYETHGGDFHISWKKSPQEHLQHVREELSRWAGRDRPPCWDDEAKRLSLRFEARCFVLPGEV